MEMFGLICAAPVILVLTLGYSLVAWLLISRFKALSGILIVVSVIPVIFAFAEVIILAMAGPIWLRQAIGPIYWKLHFGYALVPPSLLNLFLLPKAPAHWARVVVSVPIVCVIAFALILLHITVCVRLYGVEDSGGPFGKQFEDISMQRPILESAVPPNSPFHPDPDTQGLPGFEGALAFRCPLQVKPGSGERGR
jgi:hypothetical protein